MNMARFTQRIRGNWSTLSRDIQNIMDQIVQIKPQLGSPQCLSQELEYKRGHCIAHGLLLTGPPPQAGRSPHTHSNVAPFLPFPPTAQLTAQHTALCLKYCLLPNALAWFLEFKCTLMVWPFSTGPVFYVASLEK